MPSLSDITPAERKRLNDLLMRTTSDNDNEALVSVRKANELLARHQLCWTEYLDLVAQEAAEYYGAPPETVRRPTYGPDGQRTDGAPRRSNGNGSANGSGPTYHEDDVDWEAKLNKALARRNIPESGRKMLTDILAKYKRFGRSKLSDRQKAAINSWQP